MYLLTLGIKRIDFSFIGSDNVLVISNSVFVFLLCIDFSSKKSTVGKKPTVQNYYIL
jgi:hypothetical protein